jgi:hypothetical protein
VERNEQLGHTWADLSFSPLGAEITIKVHLDDLARALGTDLDDRAVTDLVTRLAEDMPPGSVARLIDEIQPWAEQEAPVRPAAGHPGHDASASPAPAPDRRFPGQSPRPAQSELHRQLALARRLAASISTASPDAPVPADARGLAAAFGTIDHLLARFGLPGAQLRPGLDKEL